MKRIETMRINRGYLEIIDQRKLPSKAERIKLRGYKEVADAIKDLAVRGAPAIGICGAMGVYLGVKDEESVEGLLRKKEEVIGVLGGTRPTAINLHGCLARVGEVIERNRGLKIGELKEVVYGSVWEILEEDLKCGEAIGRVGEVLIEDGYEVMTHCNAGGLATSGYGTALSPIFMAKGLGKEVHVYVNETRPVFQGARLTAWELKEQGVRATLICDSSAGYVMKGKGIDLVIVGADRISLRGDVANKIGTYSLAINAKEHGVPFYVAAPLTSFDVGLEGGEGIPIEERKEEEITEFFWEADCAIWGECVCSGV